MAEEQPGRELPQRVRGAARTGPPPPAPSSSPVLSEELRQRMRAAVTAERSGAATKQDEAPGGEATSPEPVRPVRPRAANAGPIAEDEITEWLGTTAKPPSSVKPPRGQAPVRRRAPAPGHRPAGPAPADSPRPAARSRPGGWPGS